MTEADALRLLSRAEESLRRQVGESIRLSEPRPMISAHRLIRCRVDGTPDLDSVIVKEITTSELTDDTLSRQSHRFLNEMATLAYLRSLGGSGPWPSLIAAEPDAGFVVLEDLGEHPTVERVLLTGDRATASRGLGSMGSTLGTFHALSNEEISRFISMRDRLSVIPPRSDSSADLRRGLDRIEESLVAFGVEPVRGLNAEVMEIEDGLHGPGGLRTIVHADSGPQNFIWTGHGTILVDYEFATVGDPFLDLVSARLGFPHSSEARTVPLEMVHVLEIRYRQEMTPVVPRLEDDSVFMDGVVDACAHWALVRRAGLWRRLFAGDGEDGLDTMRSQAFTVYRRFIETAEAARRRPALAATMDAITKAIERRMPSVAVTDTYPAFDV